MTCCVLNHAAFTFEDIKKFFTFRGRILCCCTKYGGCSYGCLNHAEKLTRNPFPRPVTTPYFESISEQSRCVIQYTTRAAAEPARPAECSRPGDGGLTIFRRARGSSNSTTSTVGATTSRGGRQAAHPAPIRAHTRARSLLRAAARAAAGHPTVGARKHEPAAPVQGARDARPEDGRGAGAHYKDSRCRPRRVQPAHGV